MKVIYGLTVLLGLGIIGIGKAADPISSEPLSADATWLSVVNPAPITAQSVAGLNTASTGLAPLPPAAQQLQQASQAANSFYTKFPTDPRAAAAKRLEVIDALECVQAGGVQYRPTATALATAFRNNTANPAADRYEVALVMETMKLSGTFQGLLIDNGSVYAALADKLYGEFGDLDRVYSLYVGVLQTTDLATSVTVAGKLLGMNAPTWAKAQAQQVIDRSNLVGKVLDLKLTASDGTSFNLKSVTAPLTVLYVWSNLAGTRDLDSFAQVASAVPTGAKLIYISVQSDTSQEAAAQAKAPLPGTFCFDAANFAGYIASYLRVQRTPYVYVLGAGGKLLGFGRVQNLPTLIAAAQN